jgi:hypothetical protein
MGRKSRSKKWGGAQVARLPVSSPPKQKTESDFFSDVAALGSVPVTYQAVHDFFASYKKFQLYALRRETMKRIEAITGIPLACYISKTHHMKKGMDAFIDDSDLTGFHDLASNVNGKAVDILLVSNGGSPESTQRIVNLLRSKFENIRFIVAGNAYSAATLLCFSGDAILMGPQSTLGPIDPQIGGIPARAILRGFEAVEKRLAEEGPKALTAYVPLISKYDLHLFEICKSAQELSVELATNWLSQYMLKCQPADNRVVTAVDFFKNYDLHKTHGRPIDRLQAKSLGLNVVHLESIDGLNDLIRSLFNQYELALDKTLFFKFYEDCRGINWGRQASEIVIELPSAGPQSASKQQTL